MTRRQIFWLLFNIALMLVVFGLLLRTCHEPVAKRHKSRKELE